MDLWRLGGLALCVGLGGCVRLSPAYGESGAKSGVDVPSSTTDSLGSTQGESQTTSRPGSSEGTAGPSETDDVDTRGPTGPGTSWGSESTSDTGTDPNDCMPDAECGGGLGDCPPGSVCNAYVDSDSDTVVAGCFELGPAAWGQACEPACGQELPRCGGGLVCASWRDEPVCVDRCASAGLCGPSEFCFRPIDQAPVGGCEPAQPCALLTQDCSNDQVCVLPTAGEDPVCLPAGMTGPGESCGSINSCMPGFACVDAPVCPGKESCCMQLCDQDDVAPVCECDDLGVPGQPSAGVCTTFPE